MTNAASLPISPGLAEQSALDRAYSKITWRLIPFLAVLWILAWIDRVNIGYAKLQMLDDLAFSVDYWEIEKKNTIGLLGEENHTLVDLLARHRLAATHQHGAGAEHRRRVGHGAHDGLAATQPGVELGRGDAGRDRDHQRSLRRYRWRKRCRRAPARRAVAGTHAAFA